MNMGLHATFMAKPFSWGASNGGHTNHSLWTTDASGVRTNAFYDADSVRTPTLDKMHSLVCVGALSLVKNEPARQNSPSFDIPSTHRQTMLSVLTSSRLHLVCRKTVFLRPLSTGLVDYFVTYLRCKLWAPRLCRATTVWQTGPGLQLRLSGYFPKICIIAQFDLTICCCHRNYF